MQLETFCRAIVMAPFLWIGTVSLGGAATYSSESIADAFLVVGGAGAPNTGDLTANNYGGAGTLAIAPANAGKGEFQSVVKFNLATIKSQFDLQYGAG